jgi:uncharacterized protein YndB with AHSA1/START domain
MPQREEKNEKIVIHKVIAATPEEVFEAWTDPESVRYWMRGRSDMDESEAQLDVRPGGVFRITMKGKNRDYVHTGEYRIVEPPSRLAFTWISEGTHNQETLVTVELKPHGKNCELTLTHEKLPGKDAASSHEQGWSNVAELLAQHFAKE